MTKIKHIEKTLNQLILERMVCCVYEIEKYKLFVNKIMMRDTMFSECRIIKLGVTHSAFPYELHQLLNNFKDIYICEDFNTKEKRYFELCDRYTDIVCAREYLLNSTEIIEDQRQTTHIRKIVESASKCYFEARDLMNKNKPEEEIPKNKITDDEIEYTLGYLGILEN